jgi:purine-binding chemotaxis protein CheW
MSTAAHTWDVLARAAATREAAASEARALRELLVFSIDGAAYALPIERIREIVRPRTLTAVPHVPGAVLGVISLRGEILQVLDTRLRLGLGPAAQARASRVIVLNGEDGRVTGLLVDAVHEVLRVEESALLSPTNADGGLITDLAPRGAGFVSLLSPEQLVALDASAA